MPLVNRLGGLLLGLVLVAVGVLVVVETALAALSRPPWVLPLESWYRWLSEVEVSDTRVLLISIGVGLIGLLILVLQLRRWAPERVAVEPGRTDAGWWMARRSVEHRIESVATRLGLRRARAKVRGDRRRWRLRLDGEADPDAHERLGRAVRAELSRLGAPDGVQVDIALRRGRVT